MSADEEGGIFTALPRLAEAGRVDMRRVMVLRVATDIDRQYPGQTACESLAESLDSTFGFVGLENISRVGSPVAREIPQLGSLAGRTTTIDERRPPAPRQTAQHLSGVPPVFTRPERGEGRFECGQSSS